MGVVRRNFLVIVSKNKIENWANVEVSKSEKLIISVIFSLVFYIGFVLFSDIGKVSFEFTKIQIEFVFLSILFSAFWT